MSKNKDYGKLVPIAGEAVDCCVCFKDDVLQLKRPDYVDLAQPRFIGDNYWSDDLRIAFVMINPGVGKEKTDKDLQNRLEEFQKNNSEESLEKVFNEQRKRLPEWANGKMKEFIELHEDVENIALVNIAWCAAQRKEHPKNKPPSWKNAHPSWKNAHPSWMLRECFKRHTSRWLQCLEPNTVILSGQDTEPFEYGIRCLLPPSTKIFTTYHYRYWQLNPEKEEVEEKIKYLQKGLKELRNKLTTT